MAPAWVRFSPEFLSGAAFSAEQTEVELGYCTPAESGEDYSPAEFTFCWDAHFLRENFDMIALRKILLLGEIQC
jgi:hypothetical protein